MMVTFLKPEKLGGQKFQPGDTGHVSDDIATLLVQRGVAIATDSPTQLHTHLVSMFQAAHGRPVLIKQPEP